MDKETEQKVHRRGNRNSFETCEEVLSLIHTKESVHRSLCWDPTFTYQNRRDGKAERGFGGT